MAVGSMHAEDAGASEGGGSFPSAAEPLLLGLAHGRWRWLLVGVCTVLSSGVVVAVALSVAGSGFGGSDGLPAPAFRLSGLATAGNRHLQIGAVDTASGKLGDVAAGSSSSTGHGVWSCVGWRQTQGCAAHADRDAGGDAGCGVVIDGDRAGYCECDRGLVAVDCGHPKLLCEAVCNSMNDSKDPAASIDRVGGGKEAMSHCLGWRQRGNCDGLSGPREPSHDRGCDELTSSSAAGYCECAHGVHFAVSCNARPLRCGESCDLLLGYGAANPVAGLALGEDGEGNSGAREASPPKGTASAGNNVEARLDAGPKDSLAGATAAVPSSTTVAGGGDETVVVKCLGWKQTGGCDGADGRREPRKDRACGVRIAGADSGFCECARAGVALHVRVTFDCGHEPLSCFQVCAEAGSANSDEGERPSANGGGDDGKASRGGERWEENSSTGGSGADGGVTKGDDGLGERGEGGDSGMGRTMIMADGGKGQCRFKQTGQCKSKGPAAGYKGCYDTLPSTVSGKCECEGGSAGATNCGHSPTWCAVECRRFEESIATIARGYKIMSRRSAVFVTITRDKASVLPQTIKHVERTAAKFSDYRVLVVEEDSKDATPAIIKQWANDNPNVVADTKKTGMTGARSTGELSLARFEKMVKLRNSYIDKIHSDPALNSMEFVIVFDSDLGLGWDVDGIAHSFGLLADAEPNDHSRADETLRATMADVHTAAYHRDAIASHWDAVCSNGLVETQQMRFYDSLAYIDESLDLSNFREHQDVVHHDLEEPRLAFSCFGGLTVYRRHALHECRYNILDDPKKRAQQAAAAGPRGPVRRPSSSSSVVACEHHGLHKCMHDKGLRLIFNSRQIVHYKPVN